MDNSGRVDAAAAGRIRAGKDIGAVFKREPINGEGPVDCRIYGKRDDQYPMLAQLVKLNDGS
jgi:hypothetical protein